MNIVCSVCRGTADLKLLDSKVMPGVRYIACHYCRKDGLEPRPLIVLGFHYGDSIQAKRFVKYRLYIGSPIEAEEIVE